MDTTKKATLADVSEACGGVHRNTVSKILSGTYTGDIETIKAVKDAAQRIGYKVTRTIAPRAHGVSRKEDSATDDELPKGVKLYEPKTKQTSNHKWTLEYSIKCACEWEFDKDADGHPILESKKAVDYENRSFSQCLPNRPTLREIEQHMSQQRALIPEAV